MNWYDRNVSTIIRKRETTPAYTPARTRTVTRTPITRAPSLNIASVIRRSSVTMPERPSVRIAPRPSLLTRIVPTAAASVPVTRGVMPSRQTATATGGGLSALPSVGSDLGLGDIGTGIGGFFSGIFDQIKTLIPIAIKIIVAVIVVKIVLWLVRGRRR